MPAKFLIFLSISTFITLKPLKAQVADVGPVPAVFTCEGILVVEKFQNKTTIFGYEQAVKKKFKDYKGNYVLATQKDIETDSLYQDKKTYRFFLHLKWDEVLEIAHGSPRTAGKMRTFYLEDRETGKIYNSFREMRAGNETLETTVKALNGSCK